MLMKHRLLLLTALLVPLNATALDFLQVLEKAETSDPDILAAEFNYQKVEATHAQSLSALLPNINLSVFEIQNYQEISNSSDTIFYPNTSSEYDNSGYTLSLTQSIYNHSLYQKLKQTDLNIAGETANINAARQSLILRVAETYYNILGAQDNLKFTEAEKNAIGQQLKQTKHRFDVGLIDTTDVKESQAKYDIAVAQEISARNLLANTFAAMRSIIGEKIKVISPLTKNIPLLPPEPADIEQWVGTALKNNLALRAAKFTLDAMQKQVSIDRAGHYPSLDLNIQHINSSIEGDGRAFTSQSRDNTGASIRLQLTVPIYSGGFTNAKVKQSIAAKEQARALHDKVRRQTEQQCRDSYRGVTTAIAEVKAFKQALVSTQTAYEATQAGFKVGTRTAVEVLAALREQYRSERDYARARYQYILNLLRLKQAAGILTKNDVVKVNLWLQR
jgi:outer membrane protein